MYLYDLQAQDIQTRFDFLFESLRFLAAHQTPKTYTHPARLLERRHLGMPLLMLLLA